MLDVKTLLLCRNPQVLRGERASQLKNGREGPGRGEGREREAVGKSDCPGRAEILVRGRHEHFSPRSTPGVAMSKCQHDRRLQVGWPSGILLVAAGLEPPRLVKSTILT